MISASPLLIERYRGKEVAATSGGSLAGMYHWLVLVLMRGGYGSVSFAMAAKRRPPAPALRNSYQKL